METLRINFDALAWEQVAPGVRFKASTRAGRKLRLVEFTNDFVESDWCLKSHFGYVLEGELEIAFPHTTQTFSAGDGLVILGGEAEKHRARVTSGVARLILVEEA